MYIFNLHHVEPEPRHPSRKHLTVTPEGLAQLIRMLRQLGLTMVSLEEVLFQNGLHKGHERQAILTFDDGYENFYQHAAPVLQQERCPATVFVLAAKLGQNNDWDQYDLPEDERDRLMTLEQVRELAATEFIRFGSHGLHHANFHQVLATELRDEIEGSYAMLTESLGAGFIPVMAYPWGYYTNTLLSLMAESPYRYGLTTHTGVWAPETSRFLVPRYSVYYRDNNPMILLGKLFRHGILSRLLLQAG